MAETYTYLETDIPNMDMSGNTKFSVHLPSDSLHDLSITDISIDIKPTVPVTACVCVTIELS